MQEIIENLKKDSGILNSLIVAICLITPAYICLFEKIASISSAKTTMLILFLILIIFVGKLLIRNKVKMSIYNFVFMLQIILFYFISKMTLNDINYSILQLGFYVLLPLFLGNQEINYKKLFKYILCFSVPIIFGLDKILEVTNVGLNQSDMYAVYAMCVPILASVIYFFYYMNKKNKIEWFLILLNIYYFIKTCLTAVRGFWLTGLVCIVLIMIFYFQYKLKKKTYYISLGILIIFLLLCIIFMNPILDLMVYLTRDLFNIEIGLFIKLQRLAQMGDLSNGRIEIYSTLLHLFKNYPLLGYGFNSEPIITGGEISYAHNYIIQLLFEGGIVLAFYPLYITIKGIVMIFKKNYYNLIEIPLVIFLISLSIPQSLLSGNCWKSFALWFTISMLATVLINKNKKSNDLFKDLVVIGGNKMKKFKNIKLKMLDFTEKITGKDLMDKKLNVYRQYGAKIGFGVRAFSPIMSHEPYLIEIGNNVTISTNVVFLTHDNSAIKIFSKGTDLIGKIVIEDDCFIGANSILLPGIRIEKNCIVGAGSVVTKSINEPKMIVAGNPATIIGSTRDYTDKYLDKVLDLKDVSNQMRKKTILKNKDKWLNK